MTIKQFSVGDCIGRTDNPALHNNCVYYIDHIGDDFVEAYCDGGDHWGNTPHFITISHQDMNLYMRLQDIVSSNDARIRMNDFTAVCSKTFDVGDVLKFVHLGNCPDGWDAENLRFLVLSKAKNTYDLYAVSIGNVKSELNGTKRRDYAVNFEIDPDVATAEIVNKTYGQIKHYPG